ncbi:hypothetical protein F4781DRAFT_438151 [Annulohypoxylon bovei var. microspora]|nr:hypothetical protein F4781DRAFT_438151 [Annulohypoxylon bovei var. microspora]
MRPQIFLLAAGSLAPNALAQSSSTNLLSASAPVSTIATIPCLVPGFQLLESGLPAPSNSALGSFVASVASLNTAQLATDPCAAATSLASALPSSLRSDAASYQSQLASFVSAFASNVSSVYAECTPLSASASISGVGFSPAEITDSLNLVTAFADSSCVRLAGAKATAAGAGGDKSKNAAVARPTGVIAGAAAAVGVMGAVALL